MSNDNSNDPLDFLKNMWGNMGFSLPGMVTPTLDTDELGKRIADLKAVEGWLKSNLNMLQMTIQGFEMQRATLAALQKITQATHQASVETETPKNPFLDPSTWPNIWSMMAAAAPAAPTAPAASEETAEDTDEDTADEESAESDTKNDQPRTANSAKKSKPKG